MARSVEHLLIPYRLRVVRIGLLATWLAIVALLAFVWLGPDEETRTVPFYILIGAAGMGAGIVSLLPWQRLFEGRWGLWLLYGWSALDIVLITLLIGFSGGASSVVFVVYFLTTVFFAASYPEKGQLGLSILTLGCYLVVLAATGWEVTAGVLVIRLGILAIMGFITSFVSRELVQQMVAHDEARRESEHRARLLAGVASAARGVNILGPDQVLASVLDGAVGLGFDVVAISMIDEETQTYRPVYTRGLPEALTERRFGLEEGLVGVALEKQGSVTVSDYSHDEHALPIVKSMGLSAAMATPLWSGGSIQAVLSVGTRSADELTEQEVEAIELLAGVASRALENAALFEEEHRTVLRLSDVDRLKDEFLSMVSHDLRTPLTVIEGSASTLDMNWARIDEKTRRKLLQVISSNAHKLGDIITKLLDLTRMEAGHFEIREEPLEMGQLLRELATRLESLFEKHDFVVDVQQPLVVEADATLIARVAENLLSNAAKYTEAGTRVELIARRSKEGCSVIVRDKGPGIPRQDLPHLGERFFRGSAAMGAVRGTGLGLAWVRQILKLHGSELRVRSVEGEGSTFEFVLPMSRAAEEAHL